MLIYILNSVLLYRGDGHRGPSRCRANPLFTLSGLSEGMCVCSPSTRLQVLLSPGDYWLEFIFPYLLELGAAHVKQAISCEYGFRQKNAHVILAVKLLAAH